MRLRRAGRVPAGSLTTRDSVVVHAASGQRLTYGELAADAAASEYRAPASLVLKRRADFRLLGTRVGNVDNHSVVTGAPIFAIDVDLPGMLHAVLERCPARGGKPVSANLEEIRALPGISAAFFVQGWPTSLPPAMPRSRRAWPSSALPPGPSSAHAGGEVVWDEAGAASETGASSLRGPRRWWACRGRCG